MEAVQSTVKTFTEPSVSKLSTTDIHTCDLEDLNSEEEDEKIEQLATRL